MRSKREPAWAEAEEVEEGIGGGNGFEEGPRDKEPRPARSSIGLLLEAFEVVGVEALFGEGAAKAASSSKSMRETC